METFSEAGHILRRLREVHGWSQSRMATELARQAKRAGRSVPSRESLVRLMRMWESGSHRPRDYYGLLILVYASTDELSGRAAAPGSELDRLMSVFEMMGVPMDRRKFLLNSAAMAVGVAAESSLLDLFDDDPVRHAIGRLRYLQGLHHSGEPVLPIYRLLVRHAGNLESLASRFRGSDVERELWAVQAQTLSVAGHAAFAHLGNHSAAEEHFRAGARAARQANDSRLRAKLLVNLAERRVHDPEGSPKSNLYDALWLMNSATQYAGEDPFVLTDIYNWQAFSHASLGSEHGTTEALERAAIMAESGKSGDKPEWLPRADVAQVQETAGCSYIRMGQPRLAADAISSALKARSGDADRLHESLILSWSAQASAMLKEPERAVSLLQRVIPVAVKAGSQERYREIRMARVALEPWEREPFIRELDDQLAAAGLA